MVRHPRHLTRRLRALYVRRRRRIRDALIAAALEAARVRLDAIDIMGLIGLADIQRIVLSIVGEPTPQELEALAKIASDVQRWTVRWSNGYMGRLLKATVPDLWGVTSALLEETRQRFIRWNTDLITSLTRELVEDITGALIEAANQGADIPELRDVFRDRYRLTAYKADLIATDQVQKLQADVDRERQRNLGIDRYVWRTVGDDRVRDAYPLRYNHRVREGEVYLWSDPPRIDPIDGHPGTPIRCRCFAEPYLPELQAAFDELPAPNFLPARGMGVAVPEFVDVMGV